MGIRRNRQPFEDGDMVHILCLDKTETDGCETRVDAKDVHDGIVQEKNFPFPFKPSPQSSPLKGRGSHFY